MGEVLLAGRRGRGGNANTDPESFMELEGEAGAANEGETAVGGGVVAGGCSDLAPEPGGAEGREWTFPAGPSGKEAAGLRPWEEPGESWTPESCRHPLGKRVCLLSVGKRKGVCDPG